jgi:hypothetical protein
LKFIRLKNNKNKIILSHLRLTAAEYYIFVPNGGGAFSGGLFVTAKEAGGTEAGGWW